jgi:cytochrome oxidase assembly protein ShyY1
MVPGGWARPLSLRQVGLAVVALILIAVMVELGRWQFGVYDDHQRADAQAALRRPAVTLTSLLGPDEAFPADSVGRPVTVSGRYLVGQQIYVRHLDSVSARYAVVTPLLTGSGSAILVVRGAADGLGSPAPGGPVRLAGVLEPATGAGGRLGADRVTTGLSIARLVGSIRPDLYSGYVILRSSRPAQQPALEPVAPPLPDPSRWAGLRNLLYACQWWLFAAFAAFMWWRMARDLAAGAEGGPDEGASSGAASETLSSLR